MLYSNQKLRVVEVEMPFGLLYKAIVGPTNDPERRIMALTCSPKCRIVKGMNYDVISYTKNGKLRISHSEDRDLYMILSSKQSGNKDKKAIQTLKTKVFDFEVLEWKTGIDKNLYHWNCCVLACPKNGIIKVAQYNSEDEIYVIRRGNVYPCDIYTLESVCSDLHIPVPCDLVYTEDGKFSLGDDWISLL